MSESSDGNGPAIAERLGQTRSRTVSWQDPTASVAAGASMAGLDYMRALIAGELSAPPISVLMRFRPTEVEEGRAVFLGEPGEEHYNPIGVVHGGYAATLLDSVMGCAVHTTLEPGVGYTSQSLEIKFVRAITRDTGPVRAVGEVVYRGRKQATVEARIHSEAEGKLLAHGTSTCMILAG